MNHLPSYVHIATLGSAFTENALVGEVTIQEKVDGSQFRWGLDVKGELKVGTKGTIIGHPDENKMFKEGAEYLFSIETLIKENFRPNTYFYGEYLQKPKHNVLCYERVPKNHIVLFDSMCEGKYAKRDGLIKIADFLGVDLIPELFRGILKDRAVGGGFTNPLDHLKRIIETTPSFLGKELIEGIVIKNYDQTILIGGQIYPLFTKYVRESFKERHESEWKTASKKTTIDEFIKSFKNEARWQKAIIHLKEQGRLEQSPRDIGNLIKLIQEDIKAEETENIKNFLHDRVIGDIMRVSVMGFAEWYKEFLIKENVK